LQIFVSGNCQSASQAAALRYLLPGTRVYGNHEGLTLDGQRKTAMMEAAASCDIVVTPAAQRSIKISGTTMEIGANQQCVVVPLIVFSAFHPDCAYVKNSDNHWLGPIGSYSPALTVYGKLKGLSSADTVSLYVTATYEALGWTFDVAKKAFLETMAGHGLDLSDSIEAWLRHGSFMYTVNHPTLRAVSDVAAKVLDGLGISHSPGNAADYFADPLNMFVYPLLPGLPLPKGVPNNFPQLKSRAGWAGLKDETLLSFDEFIEFAHGRLGNLSIADIHPLHRKLCWNRFESKLGGLIETLTKSGKPKPSGKNNSGNPYKKLPDYQFWRKAMAAMPLAEINPMVNAKFRVGRHDLIGSAGSCFAQHIARRLSKEGFNYFLAETPPQGMPSEEAISKSYGLFSARYGNIYTVRQLRQLFERAFGKFEPLDTAWRSVRAGYIDPFRPEIEPSGVDSPEEVTAANDVHLEAVRNLFEKVGVFIFTLGLTECWRRKQDGAVFPIAPGVVAADVNMGNYEFVNLSYEDVKNDLDAFITDLMAINPSARLVLTVSPVPLVATYENRHVLTSTVASKSILRAVADDAERRWSGVLYFPSYELITMSANKGMYFEDDWRSVRSTGVDHVMRAFLASCTSFGQNSEPEDDNEVARLRRELGRIEKIMCDEEMLDEV